MFGTITTIVGLSLMGLAAACILLTIAAIRCYSSKASSMDVFLLSVFVALLLDCGILIGVQAALVIEDMQWTKPLCTFYVWSWVTLRFAEVLSLLALSIDRAFILHLPTARYKFKGTMGVKIMVLVIWIFAAFMGSIPVVGWSGVSYYRPLDGHEQTLGYVDNCFYISYEIDHNYGVFIIITQVALFFSSILCLVDVHLQMRYYKTNTLFSVEAQRTTHANHTARSHNIVEVKSRSHGHVTEFHGGHQVALAHENCRLACIIAFVSYLLNHVPYTVISLIGILTGINSEHARVASLWFVLLGALVLPQTLWLFNSRYRAAYRRILNGLICRQPFCCSADLNTITLEGYLMREEVAEIIHNAHLAGIKKDDPAALNQRSTSEPNLSDVVTDSPHGSSNNVNAPTGFPRACSLDSHLDEPAVNNTDGVPTVAERDIQMSAAVQELQRTDSNVSQHSEGTKKQETLNNQSVVPRETVVQVEEVAIPCSNVVSVEMHSETCPKEITPPVVTPDKPPIPPPRRRKQGSLSTQTSVSSTATSLQTTPRQVSPARGAPSAPGSPSEAFNAITSSIPTDLENNNSSASPREEWKKEMQKHHLPPDYAVTENEVTESNTQKSELDLTEGNTLNNDLDNDLENDLDATVDLDEVEETLHGEDLKPQSIMSESLLVQSTISVEERHDSISNPSYGSPVLSRRHRHPLVMAARISSVSSSVSSGVAYEDQDIDSILDKLSLASTFTDKDDIRINTWEKIQIPEEESDQINKDDSRKVVIEDQKTIPPPSTFANKPNKKQKVNLKDARSVHQENNKNQGKENSSDNDNKKTKLKHRPKLDKSQKRKAKHSSIHRNKEARLKASGQLNRKKPNTNSLDRNALKTGEYFNAGDICDFDFSRSVSIEESQGNDSDIKANNADNEIILEPYTYADDDVWIPMTQSTESEPGMRKVDINSPVKNVQIVQDYKSAERSSLLRQNAMESVSSNSPGEQDRGETESDSPWIRRTQSEDTSTGTTRSYPKAARIYHSQDAEIV